MSVDNRLKRLLDVNGDSFASAEGKTGVSRETIRRMVNGQRPPKMAAYLRQIAKGYGIDEFALLEGATPKGEFEWSVRHASPAQRAEWLMLSRAGRVKLTVDFLRMRYPDLVTPRLLATAAGMPEPELRCLVDRWEISPPDRRVADDLAQALHSLTDISMSWFTWGGLSDRWQEGAEGLSRLSRWSRTPGLTKAVMDLVANNWD